MKPEILEIKTSIQIQKSIHEVFEAIVDPEKMSNYFIAYGSDRMEENKEVTWRFPEFDENVPVRIGKIIKDEYISYHWDNDKNEMFVEITLKQRGSDTVVSVTEKNAKNDEVGIKWLASNTEGWANFLACLKAWTEYGINLRKGAFNYRFDQK